MKKLLLLMPIMSAITLCSFGQKIGDKVIVSEETDMYLKPEIWAKTKPLKVNDTIKVLCDKNEDDYFKILSKRDTGYINSVRMTHFIKAHNVLNDTVLKKMTNKMNQIMKSIKDSEVDFERAINLYIKALGEPDKTTEYNSGDYHSKTLIWYCVKEKSDVFPKYHSVDFVLKDDGWQKENEYISDCIK